MNKIYYRLQLKAESPLSIGASDSIITDRDVLVDKCNKPFIPASSLCGVYRSFFHVDKANKIFGSITRRESCENSIDSQIIVYDAILKSDFKISNRDNVALQRTNKVAKKGSKFDCQIVEPGATFESFIELKDNSIFSKEIEDMLSAIDSGELRFGSKTTRGFGKMKLSVQRIIFTDVEKWLDFDMFDVSNWEKSESILLKDGSSSFNTIVLKLEQIGGISVREYYADANDGTSDVPDYKQLAFKSDNTPVIPATSWAGAFRTRFLEFAGDEETNLLFGPEKEKNDDALYKSKIVFDESIIYNSIPKILTRNAIDRFTGGTKEGALYTEETRYCGNTTLEIRIDKAYDGNLEALVAVIFDLNNGLLSVGGLTSVGRGLFTINAASINGIDIIEKIKANDIESIVSLMKEKKS